MINLSALADDDLLRLWTRVMDELLQRGVVRTANNPIADYAESLVATRLDLQLAGRSTAGYDAIARDGTRFQIKARRLLRENANRRLSPIRNLDHDIFDVLVVVLFAADFSTRGIWQMPVDVIRERARFILCSSVVGTIGTSRPRRAGMNSALSITKSFQD